MEFAAHRDAWGIPHLRARTPRALAFAQGHNAVRDRSWQLEVARHRARGTAASLLGPESLAWDRFARRARIGETARACFEALDTDTAAWVAAYVDGVNAGLGEAEPWAPWTPLAIWYAEHIMFGAGFPAKLWRDRVATALGENAVDLFALDGPHRSGSNAWLLAGERTGSGAPILAGDPHRILEAPGIYQQIRLACEDFDVLGLAVPGVPGIAHFGHAGAVAWGVTNAMADYQDLYRERLRRNGTGVEALGPDGWESADVRTETIEVAGARAVHVECVATARGPVIAGGTDEPFALSLRCPVRVDADLGFAAMRALLHARTVADVDAALDDWAAPVNVVLAADTAGDRLHRVAGRVPIRHRDNRCKPVPAWEPAYAWRGRHAPPRAETGPITVAANERGLAAGLGVEFAPAHRADRIRELLELSDAWSPEAMSVVHTDTLLPSAGPLLEALSSLDLGEAAARLRKRLLAWDRRMEAYSVEAAEYAALRTAVARRLAEHPALAPLAEPSPYPEVFTPWLALVPRIGYALEHLLTRGRELLSARDLAEAVRSAAEAVAAEPVGTPWGQVHLPSLWRPRKPGAPEPAPLPGVAGDHDCVLSTSSVPGVTDRCVRGPAARWVWDLSDRERSRWIVPLGAAGDDGHRHADDQLPLWRSGELVPVATDWNRLREEHPMTEHATDSTRRAPVHERTVEGFGHVGIVPLDPKSDLDLVHGWVTEERARFWGMTGYSREKVLEIYEFLDSLTTHHAYLVHRDAVPVALFQTYEPDADPMGECYDVRPGDFGVHLLVARPDRGAARAGFTAALVSVLLEFAFKDPSHRRIVVEPDARNEQARARLRRTGFTIGPEVELPDKRARLAFLDREDFLRG
ncbi:penicillin acylase family protein [Glycomyces halotolerans]